MDLRFQLPETENETRPEMGEKNLMKPDRETINREKRIKTPPL